MKRQLKNKYQGTKFQAVPKHSGTYPFHPGNDIVLDEIPAYNTQNKPYKRILPPMRDQRIINTDLLYRLLIKHVPQNKIELIRDGIGINGNEVKITKGLAVSERLKFRFIDLRELLIELKKERILHCEYEDLRVIKNEYFKK